MTRPFTICVGVGHNFGTIGTGGGSFKGRKFISVGFFGVTTRKVILYKYVQQTSVLIPLPEVAGVTVLVLVMTLRYPQAKGSGAIPVVHVVVQLDGVHKSMDVIFVRLRFPFTIWGTTTKKFGTVTFFYLFGVQVERWVYVLQRLICPNCFKV